MRELQAEIMMEIRDERIIRSAGPLQYSRECNWIFEMKNVKQEEDTPFHAEHSQGKVK